MNGVIGIPLRDSSRYAWQYRDCFDRERLMQIFSESSQLALKSKVPETAQSRYELAVEAFHQLRSVIADPAASDAYRDLMFQVAELFPITTLLNQIAALRDKARRLKTKSKRIDLLTRASQLAHSGRREYPACRDFGRVQSELTAELAALTPRA